MKLWHPVVLPECPFCAILIPSLAKLLMSPTFRGPELLHQLALFSMSGDPPHILGYTGPHCLDDLSAAAAHCTDLSIKFAPGHHPLPLTHTDTSNTHRRIHTHARTHTHTHTHTHTYTHTQVCTPMEIIPLLLNSLRLWTKCCWAGHAQSPAIQLCACSHKAEEASLLCWTDLCVYICP
jgi:hypothetical protein